MDEDELLGFDMTKFPREIMPLAEDVQRFLEKRNIYRAAIKEVSTKFEILDDEFRVKNDYNPIHHMESRVKSVQSTFQKLIKNGFELKDDAFETLTDIAGIRVICKYVDDIYRIADMIIRQDDIELMIKKDYIKNPKPSGYRSLHLVLVVPVFLSTHVEKVPVEVQIRTIVMDTWASLEHELRYKVEGELSEKSVEELKRCAYDMWHIDDLMQTIHKEESGKIE